MKPLRFAITSPHQDVKRTYTSKLSFMNGVPQKAPHCRGAFLQLCTKNYEQ